MLRPSPLYFLPSHTGFFGGKGQDIENKNDTKIKIFLIINYSGFSSKIIYRSILIESDKAIFYIH